MKIEIEREDDGRWIAEVPDLPDVMVYGTTRQDALAKAEALALRVIEDRLDHGESIWNFNEVKTVAHRGEWVLHIEFDDGLAGDLDFSEYLDKGPVFSALRDHELFHSARVENGTVTWPNGADIAPETLYEKLEVAKVSLQPIA